MFLACQTAVVWPKLRAMNPVLVVVPTYNEKDNIRKIAAAIFLACPQADILFVDDNSPDGTGSIADAMAAGDSRVNVMHRPGKQGLGRAYIAGFEWALGRSYRFVFEMDADFSHNPAELPNFLKAAEDSDLVLGSRYVNGIRIINWPLKRLILSKWASLYVKAITGMPFTDPTSGFKCFSRKVLEAINLAGIVSSGYSFQVEMTYTAWKLGFKIKEIPIVFEDRHSGTSKMSASIIREAVWLIMKLPLRPVRRLRLNSQPPVRP